MLVVQTECYQQFKCVRTTSTSAAGAAVVNDPSIPNSKLTAKSILDRQFMLIVPILLQPIGVAVGW
jgi:hypothetical protein